MARITAKSKIKADSFYTIWLRRKSWPRSGPGSYVAERNYRGHFIKNVMWDDLKIGTYRGSDAYFVYPEGEDPTAPKPKRKKAAKKAKTRRARITRTLVHEPVRYFRGDKTRATGKTDRFHGADWVEVIMIEGSMKGQKKWVPAEGRNW